VPLALKSGPKSAVIGDDAVVNDVKVSVGSSVRVRIGLRYHRVSRPARMYDAKGPASASQPLPAGHLLHRPGVFANLDAIGCKGRHAAGIVAAVFQARDTLDQHRRHFIGADDANDATHGFLPSKIPRRSLGGSISQNSQLLSAMQNLAPRIYRCIGSPESLYGVGADGSCIFSVNCQHLGRQWHPSTAIAAT
jgi:hypothetical protein